MDILLKIQGAQMTRCLLVSNRLPIQFDEKSQEFIPSSGGLVSAIKGLDPKRVGFDFAWLGIMTDDVDPDKLKQLDANCFGDIKCFPIIVPKTSYHEYYNNFCNNVIWPLFHYEQSLVQFSPTGWSAYQEINQSVADAILREAHDDDIVWIHDFHFLLVPGLLKAKSADIKVGFFLHIPFPSSEIFRELPQRTEILKSLFECDLVGFHDLSYLTHFKSCMTRILGKNLDHTIDRKWGVYPISIDSQHYVQLTDEEKTKSFLQEYIKSKGQMKWFLGVDRLDYIKGLTLKLQAFREFLRCNPSDVGRVQLVQVVIPSRTDVPEYKNLKDNIEQLVSSINGEFGSPTYMPVHYLYHSVSEYELSALYQISEVLFVSSCRDGMNLVSLEYVVSQKDGLEGSVVLSEFAGAHSTLSYAYSINPWDIDDSARQLKEALHTPVDIRSPKMTSMKRFLLQYTSSDWAQVFLRDMNKSIKEKTLAVTSEGFFTWMKNLKQKRVLFFCDLDGTLLPIAAHPKQVRMGEKTAGLLNAISKDDRFNFVIVSGRDKEFLHQQFIGHNLNFSLAACHGAYSYDRQINHWQSQMPDDTTKWRESVLEILKLYTTRCPGSFIEDKGFAITWHYRSSPAEFADFLSNKLFIELEESLSSLPAQVCRGKKVIEVKSIHANKGIFVKNWLDHLSDADRPDVIVALGDDDTDEDMFIALQNQNEIDAYCIKVGTEHTNARYYIKDQSTVDPLLEKLLTSLGNSGEFAS